MASTRKAATAVVLVMLVSAGCAAPGEAPAAVPEETGPPAAAAAPAAVGEAGLSPFVRVVEDAEGDATEHNSDRATQAMTEACKAVPASERAACRAAIPHERVGGTPAPPALDVVSLEVAESPREIVWRVGLAGLSGGATDFVDQTGTYGALIAIAYGSGTACTGNVTFFVRRVPDAIFAEARHARSHDDCEPQPGDALVGRCATANLCSLPIGWTIEPGAPGHVVMRVPRAQSALLEAGATLSASVSAMRDGIYGAPQGWSQPGGDLDTGQINYDERFHGYFVDSTERGSFTFTTAGDAEAMGVPASSIERRPVEGTVSDPQLDVTALALSDDPQNFTIAMTLAELPADPRDLDLAFQLTSPGKHHYVLTATGESGEWALIDAYRWAAQNQVPVHAEIAALPGTPGTLTLTIPRSDIPNTFAGGLTRTFFGSVHKGARAADSDGPVGYYYTDVRVAESGTFWFPPYRFTTDPAEAAATPAVDLTDVIGDVAPPQETVADTSFRKARFDIAYSSVRAIDRDTVRIDLGVVGLDRFVVPRLYDAVVYGAGFQTERGAWMVALVQEAAGEPVAFCGPDVSFLTADPRAPSAQAGVPVAHTLIPASGDAAGQLSFELPPSCFGIEGQPAQLPILRMVSRTAVVGNPLGSAGASPFGITDEAVDADGGRIVFPLDVEAPSPWAQPFGIQNFWDILGVILALLFAIVTTLLVIAKRVRMKRYLIELEDLADRHHDDPHRYADALIRLRRNTFDDFLAHRITEGHFVMIEERVRGHLSSTRINAFGRSFYQLPPALMIRLQSLLADGRFSVQDHRALSELLHELDIPEASRSDVLAQIDRWAEQDQAVARITRLARARRGWRRFLPRRARRFRESA